MQAIGGALEKLAAEVRRIVDPPPADKVIELRGGAAK